MAFILFIIDFILHIDVHLAQLVAQYVCLGLRYFVPRLAP